MLKPIDFGLKRRTRFNSNWRFWHFRIIFGTVEYSFIFGTRITHNKY